MKSLKFISDEEKSFMSVHSPILKSLPWKTDIDACYFIYDIVNFQKVDFNYWTSSLTNKFQFQFQLKRSTFCTNNFPAHL